jgi:hypothetical protein
MAAAESAPAGGRRLVNRAPVGPAWLHDKLVGECLETVFTPSGGGKVQRELTACLYSHAGTRELVRPSPAQWLDGVFAGWALRPDAAGAGGGQVYATMLYDRGTPCQLENGTMAERRAALTFACGADGPADAAAVVLSAAYPASRCELHATLGVREFCDFPYDTLMRVGVMEGSALPSPSLSSTPRPSPTAGGAAFDASGGGIVGGGPLAAAGLTPATAALVGAGVPAVLTLLALAAIYALYRRHVQRMTAQYLDGKLNGPHAAAVAAQGAHYVNKLRAAGGGASVTNPLAFAMTPAARAMAAKAAAAAAAGQSWVPELPGSGARGSGGVANPLADLFTLQPSQQPWAGAAAAQRRRASSASVASGSGGSVVVSVGGGRTQAATVRVASSVASAASSTSASSSTSTGVPVPFATAAAAAKAATPAPPPGVRAPKLPPPLTSVASGAHGAVKVPVPSKPTAAALQPQPPKARMRPASLTVAGERVGNPFAAAAAASAAAALQLSSRRASTSSDGTAAASPVGSVVGSASVSTAEMARSLDFYSPLRRALHPHGAAARGTGVALASPSTSPRSPYAPVVNENLVHSLAVRGSLPAVPAWRRRMSESSAGAGSVASSSTTDGGSSLAPALSVASGTSSVLTANALAAYRSATVAAAVSHDRQHQAARSRTNSGALVAPAGATSSVNPARAIRVAMDAVPPSPALSPAAAGDAGGAATAVVETRMPRALSVSSADAASMAAAPLPTVDPAVAAVGVAVRGNPLAAFGNLTSGQRKRALTASSDTSAASSGGARRAISVQTVDAAAPLPQSEAAAAPAAPSPTARAAAPTHARASSQGPSSVMVPNAPLGGRLHSRGARYRDGSPADGDGTAGGGDRALLRPQQAGRRNASPAVRPSGGASLRVGVTTLPRATSQGPEEGAGEP